MTGWWLGPPTGPSWGAGGRTHVRKTPSLFTFQKRQGARTWAAHRGVSAHVVIFWHQGLVGLVQVGGCVRGWGSAPQSHPCRARGSPSRGHPCQLPRGSPGRGEASSVLQQWGAGGQHGVVTRAPHLPGHVSHAKHKDCLGTEEERTPGRAPALATLTHHSETHARKKDFEMIKIYGGL